MSDLLKNVMNKKLKELDQMTERRKSCDEIFPNKEQSVIEL